VNIFKNTNVVSDDPPILCVDGIYTPLEEELIKQELTFLYSKLKNAKETGAADDGSDVLKTNKRGRWLDDFYQDRESSDILTLNRKVTKVFQSKKGDSWIWDNPTTDYITDSTLISYYGDGAVYDVHNDASFVTAITWFHFEEINFNGGDLVFPQLNIKIEYENNRTVLFPGIVLHEVTPISLVNKDKRMGGRFAITQFFHI